MKYNLHTPCDQCPFLLKMKYGFSLRRLFELIGEGSFHCHKTGTYDEETGDFVATENSSHCAGALIFLEKRNKPNQMMRIAERIGLYNRRKLNMKATVRLILPLIAISLSASASEWGFSTGDNPAMALDGKAAVIDLGEFSTGWWGDDFLQTTNTGFFDLGISGQVTTTLAPANRITVTTLEWMDHGIFSEWTAIEIAGFTNVMTSTSEVEPSPLLGGWCQKIQVFVGNLTQQPEMVLTGATNGTLLNNLTIQCEVPAAQVLARRSRQKVAK